jgi:translation initiation factor 4E
VLWKHIAVSKQNAQSWKDSMKDLCTFATIEDFWRYFNHIPRPSEVFFDGDSKKRVGEKAEQIQEYSLFKKGIEPEWGDPRNKDGGEWFWRTTLDAQTLDLYWQNMVLGVIGEALEDPAMGAHINGARVVDKSRSNYQIYKLELWIDTKDVTVRDIIRTKLTEAMSHGLPSHKMMRNNPKFEWKDHSA